MGEIIPASVPYEMSDKIKLYIYMYIDSYMCCNQNDLSYWVANPLAAQSPLVQVTILIHSFPKWMWIMPPVFC